MHILNVCYAHIVKLKENRARTTLQGMKDQTTNLLGVVGLAVADRIAANAREILNHAGETPAALVMIGYELGPTNDQLRSVLGLSHSGTVRLVDRLVREGLVERREGKSKREIALFPTKRGKAVRRQILDQRLGTIRPLLESLTDKEQETLDGLLRKILVSMDATDLERRTLCRLCDNEVCVNCPIPADF